MKSFTFIITLLAIVSGTCVVCSSLFIVFVGLVLGPILLSPLFITLVMSKLLSGTGTQIILLCSTAIYFPYFIYLFCFRLGPEGYFDFLALMYAAPIMILLWFVAGALSLTRAEQIAASAPR